METQRQWTDLAIARTTPALLGLFSLVTLMAHERWQGHDVWVRRAAWYDKTLPTFGEPCGRCRLFVCLRQNGKWFKSRSILLSASQTHSATPPDAPQWPKSS